VLSVRDKNKLDKFKFSTDFRSNLLTDALKFRHQFSERGQEEIYVCYRIIISFKFILYNLRFFKYIILEL